MNTESLTRNETMDIVLSTMLNKPPITTNAAAHMAGHYDMSGLVRECRYSCYNARPIFIINGNVWRVREWSWSFGSNDGEAYLHLDCFIIRLHDIKTYRRWSGRTVFECSSPEYKENS